MPPEERNTTQEGDEMSRVLQIKHKGDFEKTFHFLKGALTNRNRTILNRYGEIGVQALRNATPIDSGETARSWTYRISEKRGSLVLSFHNTNIQNGVPIAIILQYGHGTGTGGYVAGRDYINPAVQPVFDRLADEAWKEVTRG